MKKIETNRASKRAAKLITEVKTTELEAVTGGVLIKPRLCPTCGLGQTVI